MQEEFKGFLIRCDGCGLYLENDEGGSIVGQADEVADTCEAYGWADHGATHYCPECAATLEAD